MKRRASSSPVDIGAEYLEAWNRRDVRAVTALFAAGGVYIDTFLDSELSGAAITTHVARIFAAIPNLEIDTIGELLYGATTLASRWILRGTSSGKLAAFGPSGTAVELRGADFLRVHD